MTNPLRGYAWGSTTMLRGLRGEPPSDAPEAELWMGAHPDDPSEVELPDGRRVSLARLVEDDPDGVLGPELVAAHGPRLPYLLKLLAAETPLSIQLHPGEEQARAGLAAERDAGVPDGQRTFRDPYAKPELLVALQPFAALVGLRSAASAAVLLERVDPALAEPVRRAASAAGAASAGSAGNAGRDAVLDALGEVLAVEGLESRALVRRAAAAADAAADPAEDPDPRAGDASPDPWTWVRRLAARHPDDPAVLTPLLLDLVVLQPGEGVGLPAGVLHCYLHGLGVEVMGASDNVLRAGLTSKQVDVAQVLRLARAAPAGPTRLSPQEDADAPGALCWPVEVAEFRLRCWQLDAGSSVRPPGPGPEVLLCTSGRAVVRRGGTERTLEAGESLLLLRAGAADERVELRGPAVVFACSAGTGPLAGARTARADVDSQEFHSRGPGRPQLRPAG